MAARSRGTPTVRHPGTSALLSDKRHGIFLKLKQAINRLFFGLCGPLGSDKTINTLLISVSISKARRRKMLSRLNPESWRISPIDGCYPPQSDSLDRDEWVRFHAMPAHLTAGQRGCFLSHRRAWLKALDSSATLTVILEDDAIPIYAKRPRLPVLPRCLDVLYLHHFAQYLPSAWQFLSECLFRPFKVYSLDEVMLSHCGNLHRAAMPASAYAVTKQGANKLLSIFDKVGLFYQWDSIMLRHSISAPIFRQMLPYVCSDEHYFYRGQRPENASSRMASISLNTYAIYPPMFIHDYETPSVIKQLRDLRVP